LQDGEFQRVGGSATLKVDVRIIAATNQDLDALVKDGRFRQDLYYRLHVFPIQIPPLRERPDDVPRLISHFIEKRKQSVHKQITGISPQATASLIAYSWQGNVRELENIIQRMMVVCKGEILDIEDLPTEIRGTETETRDRVRDLKGISRESAGIVEKKAILDALSKAGRNVTRAARALGISRATLQNKMKLHGLRRSSK
jgi:transcriptional regulator with PAS, ATPase and Fis domain